MGREQVWNTLRHIDQDGPPKGEFLIEDAFLQGAGVSRERLLEELQSDLVSLPLRHQSKADWLYWFRRGYFTFALIDGPFGAMIKDLGWIRASAWIVHNPERSRGFMADYLQDLHRLVNDALENGCEGLILADDLAGQRGLLVAPDYLQGYYFPEIGEWLDKYRRDIPVIFHSDGNFSEIVADLKQVGFRGIQGLQPDTGMNKGAFTPEILHEMVFWGNFRFEGPHGLKTVEEVQKEAPGLCEKWRDASYIFGSSSGLYSGLPLELVRSAYRALF